jgi:hypothetical protein
MTQWPALPVARTAKMCIGSDAVASTSPSAAPLLWELYEVDDDARRNHAHGHQLLQEPGDAPSAPKDAGSAALS